MILQFVPIRIFREKTQVSFFDARIDGSNGSDVVIHHKNAISPSDEGCNKSIDLFENIKTIFMGY